MGLGGILLATFGVMFIAWFFFGGPMQYFYSTYAPEAWREKPGTIAPEAKQVDLSVKLYHVLDQGAPAATAILTYDANKVFIESATSSSGIATFSAPYWEGETIYYQVRSAAPSAATYVTYETPLTSVTVPNGDANGDSKLPMIGLWETSTSVATFSVFDQDMKAIAADPVGGCVNTTDTAVHVFVSITADCTYGTPAAFTDTNTGKSYLAGAWLVITTNTTLGLKSFTYMFGDMDYNYYLFNIPMIVYDSDFGYKTGHEFTMDATASTGITATADALFTVDLYDTMWAESLGGITTNSWLNGDSDLNPAVLSAEIWDYA
jgi:hypothetical protein